MLIRDIGRSGEDFREFTSVIGLGFYFDLVFDFIFLNLDSLSIFIAIFIY